MQIKNYNYSENTITTSIIDTQNGSFVWLGFAQDTDGNCAFQKLSASNPLQNYFDIDIAVTEIVKATISGQYIYLALSDSSLIGKRYNLANPLSTVLIKDFEIPAGITEAPVDIASDGTYVYFLTPGDLSGTNSKITKFTIAGVYDSTIDLSTITNASSFTIDENDEIQVITYESPVKLVRVYDLATTPQYSTTEITD